MFDSKNVPDGMSSEEISINTQRYADQADSFYLSENISSYSSIEADRKKLINSLFCLFGSIFLFFFGFAALGKGLHGLAMFTLTSAFFSCLVFLYQKLSGDYEKTGYAVVAICVSLFLYLLITGGYENTGPLWCYVLSILILFVLEEKKGLMVNGALITYMLVAFSVDDSLLLMTSYSREFELRFVATFMAIFIMAMIYERSHAQAKKAMAEVGEHLFALSRIDFLTKVFNRRAMRELMEYESLRVRRTNKPYGVLYIDIDLFKAINDRYGHDCGDFVLQQLAATLTNNLRNSDTVCRWGGEEFVVLLPETAAQDIVRVGEKVRNAIERKEFVWKDERIVVTASVGGASFDVDESFDETINRADEQLYRAKKAGRNRVVV